jgi:hypothetical protein
LNVLVLKVVNEWDQWLASIRLVDGAGQPVKGIRFTTGPALNPSANLHQCSPPADPSAL